MLGVFRKLRRGVAQPRLVFREVNKLYYRIRGRRDGVVDVFEADWDNLVLLDACRYDVFAERHDLPGTLERRTIGASSTLEFLERYVDGTDLRDTVYVTANPQLRRHRERFDVSFHDVIDIWEGPGWDESLSTVPPDAVVDAAIAAHQRYPDKRLVIHFIQPHHPFIGPTGRDELQLDSIGHFYGRVFTGELDVDDSLIRRAYEENFDIVMEAVDGLLAELDGRTVVTADHGEMIGETAGPIPMAEYGHPSGLPTPELITVPWLVYDNGPRREVSAGEAAAASTPEPSSDVERRLEDLGYV